PFLPLRWAFPFQAAEKAEVSPQLRSCRRHAVGRRWSSRRWSSPVQVAWEVAVPVKTRDAILLAAAAVLAYRYRSQLGAFAKSFGAKTPAMTTPTCKPPFSIINGQCTMVVNCPPGVVC